LTFSKNKR